MCNISTDLWLFTPPDKEPHSQSSQPCEGNRLHIQPARYRELSCGIKYYREQVSFHGKVDSCQHPFSETVFLCIGLVAVPVLSDWPQLLSVGRPRWRSQTKGLVSSWLVGKSSNNVNCGHWKSVFHTVCVIIATLFSNCILCKYCTFFVYNYFGTCEICIY